MGMIKVRATGKGFNGGGNPDARGLWGLPESRMDLAVEKRDRGLKNIGDVFMIDESKFTDTWMERMDAPKAAPAQAPAVAAPVAVEYVGMQRKPGRPKKIQPV